MTSSDHPPAFLSAGTFRWDRLGYRLAPTAPRDLMTAASLNSGDPWIVLAATLERAKGGDRHPVSRLTEYLTADAPPLLVRGCMHLLADAGGREGLHALASLLDGTDEYLRQEAAVAAGGAGTLWLMTNMLTAWRLSESRQCRDTIASNLSRVLEEEPDDVSSPEDFTEDEYEKVVLNRLHALSPHANSDPRPFHRGRVFGVRQLAERAVAEIGRAEHTLNMLGARMLDIRRRFEASTGENCSDFFVEDKLQPLTAAATLETFLTSEASQPFELGVRYFFRQPIDDSLTAHT